MSELQVSHLWRYNPGWLKVVQCRAMLMTLLKCQKGVLRASCKKTHNLAAATLLENSLNVKDSAASGDW